MPEFSFTPPHTLFIDAALQAQDDSELIGSLDRVNNEVRGARARRRLQSFRCTRARACMHRIRAMTRVGRHVRSKLTDGLLVGERAWQWIMDAVTHQPLGKHAAIKGTDGVFYWDLNRRPEITPGVCAARALALRP